MFFTFVFHAGHVHHMSFKISMIILYVVFLLAEWYVGSTTKSGRQHLTLVMSYEKFQKCCLELVLVLCSLWMGAKEKLMGGVVIELPPV